MKTKHKKGADYSNLKRLPILILILVGMMCHPALCTCALGCTSFLLENGKSRLLGANYDWNIGVGLIMVNKRGLKKTAIAYKNAQGQPMSWVSKYGSVTFNQYGRELPVCGINEAGLVVNGLILDRSTYPESDSRPYIGKSQWKQYVLDNYKSVDELISKRLPARVLPSINSPGLHYFICDRTGNCAIIEYINGKRVVYNNSSLPLKVITNRTYKECVDTYVNHTPFFTDPNRALERFIIVAKHAEKYQNESTETPIAHAFKILNKVAQGHRTKWSIVYDLDNLHIHFRTVEEKSRKWIDLNSVAFSCDTATRVFDINSAAEGDVTHHSEDYSEEINLKLIQKAFTNTYFLKNMPLKVQIKLAKYPESFRCQN